ncbi:MAG: nuclear transport factor 2 family protein [Gammaproteobacteria bacterium]
MNAPRLNTPDPVAEWHRILEDRDIAALASLLHDDAVFLSPVVHTPQRGKRVVMGYLGAAAEVLGNPSFRYVREIIGARDAMLEFETEIDGIEVNGIDLIRWDDAGRIVEFKVMVRPLKAIQAVHAKMAERLQSGSAALP